MKIQKFLVQIEFPKRQTLTNREMQLVIEAALSDEFVLQCFGAAKLTVVHEEQPMPVPINFQQPTVRG